MSQTEIQNLIDLYSKKLIHLKKANSLSSLKLPKLFHNNSYHNFIKRKLEKLNSLNSRNKYNSGEKRIKQDLSTLFNIRKVNDFVSARISKVHNTKKIFTNSNIVNNNNNNSSNSLNTNLNNSNTKTSTSNNGNYKNNIVINKIKIIKSNENDTDKQNNEHFFFKKKYYINRNNYNKDIYNLIYTDNFNYFFSKVYSTPRKDISIKPLNYEEQEKSENN